MFPNLPGEGKFLDKLTYWAFDLFTLMHHREKPLPNKFTKNCQEVALQMSLTRVIPMYFCHSDLRELP